MNWIQSLRASTFWKWGLFLLGWASLTVSVYWLVLQPPTTVSRVYLGISGLTAVALIITAGWFFDRPLIPQWDRKRMGMLMVGSFLLFFGRLVSHSAVELDE